MTSSHPTSDRPVQTAVNSADSQWSVHRHHTPCEVSTGGEQSSHQQISAKTTCHLSGSIAYLDEGREHSMESLRRRKDAATAASAPLGLGPTNSASNCLQ